MKKLFTGLRWFEKRKTVPEVSDTDLGHVLETSGTIFLTGFLKQTNVF